MYIKKAIERLNNINWSNIGLNGYEKDMDLGYEFIRRMSVFCKEQDIKPTLPFMMNISSYFGNIEIYEDIVHKCNEDLKKIIKTPSFSNSIVGFYLQISLLADQNFKYAEYIKIYEPLTILFERGGNFLYRERGMSFMNSGLIPLSNWFENFKDKSAKL